MTKNMEKNFDFNKIGKRMPYTVPEGFFDEMERDIMQQAGIMRTEAPRPMHRTNSASA